MIKDLIKKATLKSITIRREGARVLLLHDGRLLCDLDYRAATILARAIHAQAKRAEEQAKALDIVADQALLIRAGVPLGLSARPDILAEAAKQAAWDSRLRRALPGGIRSQAVFGTPTVRKDPTK